MPPLLISFPLISVPPQGKIARITSGDHEAEVLQEFNIKSSEVRRLEEGMFFMPGEDTVPIDITVHDNTYTEESYR